MRDKLMWYHFSQMMNNYNFLIMINYNFNWQVQEPFSENNLSTLKQLFFFLILDYCKLEIAKIHKIQYTICALLQSACLH